MKKSSTICAPAIVDYFYMCGLRLKIGREYDPHSASAHAIVTLPLTGRLSHVNSDRLARQLLDCPLDRLLREIVVEVPPGEKFVRLPAERQAPFHRRLNAHAYGAYRTAGRFLVQFFDILLLFLRHIWYKRSTQADYFGIHDFTHAFANDSLYFIFHRRGHFCSIALGPMKLQCRSGHMVFLPSHS